MSKTLVFAIYDFDRFSKHDQIGEVKVPLCQIDLAQTIEEWAEVTSVEGEGGQVNQSLNIYNPISHIYIDVLLVDPLSSLIWLLDPSSADPIRYFLSWK